MSLSIALIQANLSWENKQANISNFENLISEIKESVDLILLPEMFATGFTMQSHLFFETMNGEVVTWMKAKAKQYNSIIGGSLIIKENEKYYNRFVFVYPPNGRDSPYGDSVHYDKRHLFRMGNEQEHYTPGSQKIMLQIKNWKIAPFVCYDLRFPVWSRRTKEYNYDLALYTANWPEVRSYPWQQLLIARAIENQAFVIGLNRVGEDGNKINHNGCSAVIDFKGNYVKQIPLNKESVEIVRLEKSELDAFRKVFPAELDADEFELKL